MKVIFYITVLTCFFITNVHALPSDLLSKTIGKIKSDKTDKTKYKKFYKYASNFEDYLSLALDPVKVASKNLEEVKLEKVNKYTSNFGEYFFNLIPGKGITEVSVDLRENYKPDYSILITRELKKLDNGNYFMQFSLFSSEVFNDERYTA